MQNNILIYYTVLYCRYTISQKSSNQNIVFNQISCCPKPNSRFFKYLYNIIPYTYTAAVYTITLTIYFSFFPNSAISSSLTCLCSVCVLGRVYLYIMYIQDPSYTCEVIGCVLYRNGKCKGGTFVSLGLSISYTL